MLVVVDISLSYYKNTLEDKNISVYKNTYIT